VILVCVLGQFSIDFTYQSKNGTGTGQIVLEIDTVDGIPVGKHNLTLSFQNSFSQQ